MFNEAAMCHIAVYCVCDRGEEPVIRGYVEICASQLQTSSSEGSSQHHQSTGKRWCLLSILPTVTL